MNLIKKELQIPINKLDFDLLLFNTMLCRATHMKNEKYKDIQCKKNTEISLYTTYLFIFSFKNNQMCARLDVCMQNQDDKRKKKEQ